MGCWIHILLPHCSDCSGTNYNTRRQTRSSSGCCRAEDKSHSLAPTARTSTMNIKFVPKTILTLIIVQILSNGDFLLHTPLPSPFSLPASVGWTPVPRFQHSLLAGCDREHSSGNAGTTSLVGLILRTMHAQSWQSLHIVRAHSPARYANRNSEQVIDEHTATFPPVFSIVYVVCRTSWPSVLDSLSEIHESFLSFSPRVHF
jgi:hypothetical protein